MRPAAPADADRLAALRDAAALELRPARGGELLVMAELGGRDGRSVRDYSAVAELDGVVVGYLEAELLRLEDERLLVRVRVVYVEPAAREVGAGEALLAEARRWAVAEGAHGLDALVLPGQRDAKNLFERAGYAARLLVMHHRLEP